MRHDQSNARAHARKSRQTCLFRWAARRKRAHRSWRCFTPSPTGKNGASEGAPKGGGEAGGVPDMFLPVAREGCHGLYIELKRRDGGRVSTEQTAWMDARPGRDTKTALCRLDAAREEIQRYLGGNGHEVEQDREKVVKRRRGSAFSAIPGSGRARRRT